MSFRLFFSLYWTREIFEVREFNFWFVFLLLISFLVDDEAQAKEVIEQLDGGKASFDELAQKYSKDQPDLGYFTAEMMVPEFSNAAFAMEKDTYSKEPVKTEFGFHVIYVEDVRDSKPLELDAVKEQIKANLSQQAVAEIIKELNDRSQIEKFDLNGKKIEAPKEEKAE